MLECPCCLSMQLVNDDRMTLNGVYSSLAFRLIYNILPVWQTCEGTQLTCDNLSLQGEVRVSGSSSYQDKLQRKCLDRENRSLWITERFELLKVWVIRSHYCIFLKQVTFTIKAVASEDPSLSELVLASLVPSKTQVTTNTKMLHDPVAAYLQIKEITNLMEEL